MTYADLVFDNEDAFDVVNVVKDGYIFLITVHSKQVCSHCPDCSMASKRLHSCYWRQVMDLPVLNGQTRIRLKCRKFYCKNINCSKKVFSERFSLHFNSGKRITSRAEIKLLEIAHQQGGNAGEKLCRLMNLPASDTTLVRLINKQSEMPIPTPRVLGIDDWAYTKRINYGTILVDMERRKVIDLLPDRETETVEKWLKAHPGVEIVTRDRYSNFANGVKQASESIIQIADRWHLLHNLTEAIKKMLVRNHHYLKETREGEIKKELDRKTMAREVLKKAQFEENSILHKRFTEIKELLDKGYSKARIAREMGVCRNTVFRWSKRDGVVRRKKKVQTNIALYEDQVRQMIHEKPGISTFQIWLNIKEMGYDGGQASGYKQIGKIKGRKEKYIPKQASTFWKPAQASFLICKKPKKLTQSEKEMIKCLCKRSKEIKTTVNLARKFRLMMENKEGDLLKEWISLAASCGVKELSGFAKGLLGDFDAVQNAMSSHWSNGQVEGQVNKLKMIKRQMYGRASFCLLRKRLIHQSA